MGKCVKHGRVRFHRIREFKQYSLSILCSANLPYVLLSTSRLGVSLRVESCRVTKCRVITHAECAYHKITQHMGVSMFFATAVIT